MLRNMTTAVLALIAAAFAGGCQHKGDGPYYSATQQAIIQPGVPFAEGKLAAILLAERKARDQVLLQAMNRTFRNGTTLEDAASGDPFLRAKVYDIIRTAKVTDQTIKEEENLVSVTVRLDMEPIIRMLDDPAYQPTRP